MKWNSVANLILISMLLVGCENAQLAETASDDHSTHTHTHADGTTHSDHSHGNIHSHDNAPHGGTVADWGGGQFHVELTIDHDKQEATVYVLGSDSKSAAPIAAEEIQLAIESPQAQFALQAMPLDGETDGLASRFIGRHEVLAQPQKFRGRIFGNVDGKQYLGSFAESER